MMHKCNYCHELKEYTANIGRDVYICKSCQDVVNNERQLTVKTKQYSIMRPDEIKKQLDRFVVGQEEAKKTLAIEAYNHLKKLHISDLADVDKNNILLVGPSGCGKTYLVETLAKIINVPFVSVSATEFTASGYVGKSISSIAKYLLEETNYNYFAAEHAIVFIDEIDKIAGFDSYHKDVGGVEVQKELLKIIEGERLRIDGDENGYMDFDDIPGINTKNILFIFSGAFESLRQSQETSVSFSPSTKGAIEITPEVLIKNGFLKEFIGRIPIVSEIDALTVNDIVNILTKVDNNLISQYQKMLAYDHIDLRFTDEAIWEIASEAQARGIGARGCKYILGNIVNKVCYFTHKKNSTKIIIDKDTILNLQKNNKSKNENV